MRLLALLGSLILLASCASSTNYYPQTVQSWQNGNILALIKAWGIPDQRIISPSGNTLLIYRTHGYNVASQSSEPTVGVNYRSGGHPVIVTNTNTNMTGTRSPLTLPCVVLFEADKSGHILDTQTQGAGCYGNANFAKSMSNPGSSK